LWCWLLLFWHVIPLHYFSDMLYPFTVYRIMCLSRLLMSFFSFSCLLFFLGFWNFSSHICWVLHNAARITHNMSVPCCFPFLMWLPTLHVLGKWHIWNIISVSDWKTYIQLLMSSAGNCPHATWRTVAVGRWNKENTSSCRSLPHVVSCTRVPWSITVHPMLISTLALCTSCRSHMVWTQWHWSCRGKFVLAWWGWAVWMTHKNMGPFVTVCHSEH
jgi:hypothetical protein